MLKKAYNIAHGACGVGYFSLVCAHYSGVMEAIASSALPAVTAALAVMSTIALIKGEVFDA